MPLSECDPTQVTSDEAADGQMEMRTCHLRPLTDTVSYRLQLYDRSPNANLGRTSVSRGQRTEDAQE